MRRETSSRDSKDSKDKRKTPRSNGFDRFTPRKRISKFVQGDQEIDYRDYELLRKFMTERGKITPARIAGVNARQQRQIKRAIRRARAMGLLP